MSVDQGILSSFAAFLQEMVTIHTRLFTLDQAKQNFQKHLGFADDFITYTDEDDKALVTMLDRHPHLISVGVGPSKAWKYGQKPNLESKEIGRR